MNNLTVYCMRASDEEHAPFIDFRCPENGANVPWCRINNVLQGKASDNLYVSVNLKVDHAEAKNWHYYPVAGTFGLFSKAVIDLIGPHMEQCFDRLEASINGAPYFFLRKIATTDCLDREHSDMVSVPHDPSQVMRIKRYRFHKERIMDPSVFVIPETSTEIFATQRIKESVEGSRLKGIVFLNAEEQHRQQPKERKVNVKSPQVFNASFRDLSKLEPINDDVDRIEHELGLILPQYYKEYLRNYPSELVENKWDLGYAQEAISERYFRNDPTNIIATNKEIRSPEITWTDEGPWPDQYLAIGDDQCGNYWAISLKSKEEAVFYYDHDYGEFKREHESLQAFADHLLREVKKHNASG